MSEITEQKIRERAYELWEANGKPEGSANRYWLEAERQLREELGINDRDKTERVGRQTGTSNLGVR